MIRAMVVVCVVALACGCNRNKDSSSATGAPQMNDAKALLKHPVDFKAISAKVLGLSTRELRELLGPPDDVLTNHPSLGFAWVYSYPIPGEKKNNGNVIFVIRNDRVVQVT